MAKTSVTFEAYFKPVASKGVNVFKGGMDTLEISPLADTEAEAIDNLVDEVKEFLLRISSTLAAQWEKHREFFKLVAQFAKAKIGDGTKSITYPPEFEQLGVLPLLPQAIRYVATPDTSNPAYTSYELNSWKISLTAGTPAYIFGDGTHYYKACPTEGKRIVLAIIQHGLLEINTEPRLCQMRLWSERENKYGAMAVHPLKEFPIEKDKTLYQYNTPAALMVTPYLGIMWKILPDGTGVSKLPLLGVFFFEVADGNFKDVTWRS